MLKVTRLALLNLAVACSAFNDIHPGKGERKVTLTTKAKAKPYYQRGRNGKPKKF